MEHFERARALIGLKRGTEAEASALKARDMKPDDPQVFLVLANSHIQERKHAAVLQDFDGYLKVETDATARETIRERRDRLQRALQSVLARRNGQPRQLPLPTLSKMAAVSLQV
jgi:chromosome condensin MukBEF ATPase and DNA-binding subunit MukB